MNTNDRNAILEMLADGRITATEAIALLDQKEPVSHNVAEAEQPIASLKAEEARPSFATQVPVEELKTDRPPKPESFQGITITEDDVVPQKDGQQPRWLKIRVRELDTGRNRVSVTLPLGLVNFGLGIARRFGSDFDDDYRVDDIWRLVKEGQRGMLIDVEDEEDNEQVQIYLD